jgi:hypothetical protein
MISKVLRHSAQRLSLCLMVVIGTAFLHCFSAANAQSKQPVSGTGSQAQPDVDVRGTWSGTSFSRHSNTAPFTMTLVISADSDAHLIGTASLNSDCLKNAKLVVTVTGSNVVLAGSDEEGDNMTVRGIVDSTGTLLKASYILNGSASGRCETDDGTANLGKR